MWWDIRRKQTTQGQDTCSKMTSLRLRGGGSTTTMAMEVPVRESIPAPVVTANVTEFLSNFDDTARDIAIFGDDKLFEETYGFTMSRYLRATREIS